MHETQFHYQKGYKPSIEQQKRDKVLIDAFVEEMKRIPEALSNEQGNPSSPRTRRYILGD